MSDIIQGRGLLIFAGSERECTRKANQLIGGVYVLVKKLTKTESEKYWKEHIHGAYYPGGYPPLPEYGGFLVSKEDIRKWKRMNEY